MVGVVRMSRMPAVCCPYSAIAPATRINLGACGLHTFRLMRLLEHMSRGVETLQERPGDFGRRGKRPRIPLVNRLNWTSPCGSVPSFTQPLGPPPVVALLLVAPEPSAPAVAPSTPVELLDPPEPLVVASLPPELVSDVTVSPQVNPRPAVAASAAQVKVRGVMRARLSVGVRGAGSKTLGVTDRKFDFRQEVYGETTVKSWPRVVTAALGHDFRRVLALLIPGEVYRRSTLLEVPKLKWATRPQITPRTVIFIGNERWGHRGRVLTK